MKLMKLHTDMSYSGYKGKVRIIHAFSAGGVVYRRTSPTDQTAAATPEDVAPAAASAHPAAMTAAVRADGSAHEPSPPAVYSAGGSAATDSNTDSNDEGMLDGVIEVVLVGRPRDNNWTLPKGTPGQGESQEETALREVCEETGLTVRILEEIGSIHYWFSRRGVRYKKEVLHYLMEATGGDLSLHDHEYDEARWFPLAEATQRLAHENEIEIVRRAEELIQRLGADPSLR